MRLEKIVSGGQTGADQAGLDVAIKLGIPHGGWIPKGRLTEAGPLPDHYQLQEMPTANYPKRTKQNIIDSDGTLVVSHGKLAGGSKLTATLAEECCKPYLHLDLGAMSLSYSSRMLASWVRDNGIKVLNVAGPRASKDAKIYNDTVELLTATLQGKKR